MRRGITALFVILAIGLCIAGCRRRKTPKTPTHPDWMEAEVAKQVYALSPGAPAVGPLLKATAYREDAFTRWPMILQQGQCYIFSGLGDETVDELSLELHDPDDDRVARMDNDSPRVVMEYCVAKTGRFQLQAKVNEGYGHYAVGVYFKQAGDTPPAPSASAEPTPDNTLQKVIDEMASSKAPKVTRVGDSQKGDADKTDWYVALTDKKCYTLIVAGDDGVKKLELGIWDPDDKRAGSDKSATNRASVSLCPKLSGMHRVQAKVLAGKGKYELGVFAKDK